MVVVEPKGRRDGKSSFTDLVRYVTDKFTTADLPGFGQLVEYVSNSVDGETGEEKTLGVLTNGVRSIETAAKEMYAVAGESRSQNPVKHFIMSWPEHEAPEQKAIFAAAQTLLKDLGLADHQYVCAIHGNTDNIHCHIAVNRVHPESFLSQPLPWLHKAMHRSARHIEIEHGWTHDNGLFVVSEDEFGNKTVVENPNYKVTDDVKHENFVLRKRQDAWNDKPSLMAYAKEHVYADLKSAVENNDSWSDVNVTLASHGLRLIDAGGGFQISPLDNTDKSIRIPASKIFRFLSKEKLVDKFGEFEAPSADIIEKAKKLESSVQEKNREREWKRDPDKRAQRRLERAAARTELVDLYREDMKRIRGEKSKIDKALKEVTSWKNAQKKEIQKKYNQQRLAVMKDDSLSDAQKRTKYSLIAFARTQEIGLMTAEADKRKAVIREATKKVPSWREWLESQAKAGNAAAVSALRGIVYQARREAKKSGEPLTAITEEESLEGLFDALDELPKHERKINAIRPAMLGAMQPYHHDVLLKDIAGLSWIVTNNGNVEYRHGDNSHAFTDKGNKVTFDRAIVTDNEIRIALMHASEKFGYKLTLSGDDPVFTDRMLRLAVEMGITVANKDLQERQTFLRDELHRERKGAQELPDYMVNVTDKETGEITAISELVLLKRLVHEECPHANVAPSNTASGKYVGKILDVTPHYVAQQVGRDYVVIHDRLALGKESHIGAELKRGIQLDVRYSNDKVVVSAAKAELQKSKQGGRNR